MPDRPAEQKKTNAVSEAVEVDGGVVATVVTGAVIAALQPELLPGMAIGAAAALGPRLFPAITNMLRPVVRTAVRTGYAAAVKTREVVAEAGEQVQDMLAEARDEQERANAHTPSRHAGR